MKSKRDAAVDELTLHPQAALVPEMPPDEYAVFAADVAARGVKVALDLLPGTGTVLDGRTRLRAARDAGLKAVPVTDADLGGEPPVAYMLRAAVSRRHLSSSQRAVLAVEIEAELAKAAKVRQRANGGDKKSRGAKARGSEVETVPPPKAKARDEAAAATRTNPRYVSDAKRLKERAPELLDRVKAGDLTIPQAKAEVKRQAKREELKAKAAAAPPRSGSWEVLTGDCVARLEGVGRGTARLVFADPPYNVGVNYGDGHDDARPLPEYLRWCSSWVGRCHDVLSADGSLWVLINHEHAAFFELILRGDATACLRVGGRPLTSRARFHVRSWVTWYETFGVNCANGFNRTSRRLFYCVKDPKRFVFHPDAVARPSARQTQYNDARANPAGKLLDDVWFDIPRLPGTAAERMPDFPTQLPLALLRRVVSCSSDPGDLVVDPFSGSGTTGVAAVELGRRYLGVERSAVYAEMSRGRIGGATAARAG